MLDVAREVAGMATKLNLDYCESRIQKRRSTRIVLNHGHFKQATYGIDRGAGIRVLSDNAWGFSSSSNIDPQSLRNVCDKAAGLSRAASSYTKEDVDLSEEALVQKEILQHVSIPPSKVDIEEKMNLIRDLYNETMESNSSIVNAEIRYGDLEVDEAFVTSDGTEIFSRVIGLFVAIDAIAKSGDKIATCGERFGKLGGYELVDKGELSILADTAVQRSLELLDGKPAPSGRFSVVTDPRLTGVFAHEAVGHACEADAIAADESILNGRMGDRIGADLVTIFDDSTLPDAWGSREYDSEGVKTQKRRLVEKGVLNSLIYDKKSAGKLGTSSNGGARTQSYAFPPIVRMSNTYVLPGDWKIEEMLDEIDYGILLKGSRGGAVDVARGIFQFNAEEAHLIEKGEVTLPLLNVSMSGLILETLSSVVGVSKDLCFSIGTCGKSGQGVPVSSGGPFLHIENVVVGGSLD